MKTSFRALVIGLIGIAVSHGCGRKVQTVFNSPKSVSSRPVKSEANPIQFSLDNKYLMIAGFYNRDKRLSLWDVGRQHEIERLKAKPIFGGWNGDLMLLMPDFKTLITTWGAWDFKVVDVRKRRPNKTINVNNGYISDLDVSPDGKLLVIGMTAQVQVRDAGTYRLLRTYYHGGQATQVNFGPDSRIVRCTWRGMKPHFVDVQTAKRVPTPISTRAFEVTWSPDKKYFARVTERAHLSGRTSIELWKRDKDKSTKLKMLASTLIEIQTMQFSPDEKVLVAGGLSATQIPVEFFKIP